MYKFKLAVGLYQINVDTTEQKFKCLCTSHDLHKKNDKPHKI